MTEMTHANATHLLECSRWIFGNSRYYTMRCHVIKTMPDGERLKVLVFGERNWKNREHIVRVRYVESWRVSERKQ